MPGACVDGSSSYLYIVPDGYMRILGALSVQSCCTLSISASYYVFSCGTYRKSRLVCVWLSDLDLSRHHLPLWGAVPAIQRVRMTDCPQNGNSSPHWCGWEVLTQFAQFVKPL